MLDLSGVLATLPAADMLAFPPAVAPVPLLPAPAPPSVLRPFNIPDALYLAALDARVPLTVAATYAVSVKLLNRLNRSRGRKPWAVSRTRAFFAFVVLHNVLLALYSAWTFAGMLGVMRRAVASPFGPDGPAATVDSLCRIQGPAGLGASVYFNDSSAAWDSASPASAAALLDAGGLPGRAAAGRIWAEGLAYYGWIFYLSKFYEVLDTFIILAKGKYSSTLQTYHHAGAMMCMWAGIRYMSAPIWVFCLFNSFIHALMYTYYTLSAFNVKVPMALKRSLTSMQITQFIVGASCAMVHSFITFLVPVAATPSAAAAAADPDGAIPTAAGTIESLKHLVLGAGHGGSMPPVPSAVTDRLTIKGSSSSSAAATAHLAQPCIASSSESFAIWLNVLYLAPLTYLFVSFFISSYVKRSNAASKLGAPASTTQQIGDLAEKAGWEAARNVEREVYGQDGAGSPKDTRSRSPTRRAD